MSYWSTTIFLLSFFLYPHTCLAFQEPLPPYQFSIPELNELRLKVELKINDGLISEALGAYQILQKKCWEYNLDSISIDLYEDIFTATILLEEKDLEGKLNFIDSCFLEEKDTSLLGVYYGALAHAYLFYGEVDSMEKYYTLAIPIYYQQKRYLQATNLNVNIAIEYYYLEDLMAAKKYLNKAEELEEDYLHPRNLYTPGIYTAQTAIYTSLQKYDKAIKGSLAIIKYFKTSNSITDYSLAYEYNSLAKIYDEIKDYENSLDYHLKALDLLQEIGENDPDEITYITLNIGLAYSKLNQIATAKKYFLQSLKLIEQANTLNPELEENLINNCHFLITCYQEEQKNDSVFYYFHKLLEVHQTNSYRINYTYFEYSYYFLTQHNLKNAQIYAFKTLEATKRIYGIKSPKISDTYILLARILFAKRSYAEAFQYLQRALNLLSFDFLDDKGLSNPSLEQVIDKDKFLNVLNVKMHYLNILYNQDYPLATEKILYQTAKLATQTIEAINKEIKGRKSQLFWLNQEAIPSFERAIVIALSVYEKTNNLEYLNEAFVLAERSKSMLMVNSFQGNEAFNFGGLPKELVEEEQDLEKLLAETKKKRFDAKLNNDLTTMEFQDSLMFEYKHQMMTLLHTFELEYPTYFKLKHAFKSVDIRDIQQTIDAQTTFIEYFEGASNIYAFSITKNTASVHSIPRTADYSKDIIGFQATLIGLEEASKNTAKSYRQLVETGYQFYQKFLQNSLAESQERLIIIPDGQLSYLPFEAFLTKATALDINQSNSKSNFATLPYLVRDYKINYHYSATLWIEHLMRNKVSKNGRILALAPSYKNKIAPEWRSPYEKKLRAELVELPGALRELDFLKWEFEGSFLANNYATETAFKEAALDYSILHFAVHGLVDTKNPEFSGLALSEDGSKKEDNVLYTYEIKQLGLNADLVVLSACETGIGKYQLGEGILSIGRDFMYAGVPSMVTTLWSLNDYSSSIIVEQFYRNLGAGMEKDEALRQAKLFYLDNYNGLSTHPALWACFIQIGDYSSIPVHKSYRIWYIGFASAIGFLILVLVFWKFKAK
jgi:CHAT domain-containing protein